MQRKYVLTSLALSIALNLLLSFYIVSEQKYKSIQFQAYKIDYARCDADSITSNAEAYRAWKENQPKPVC